MINSDGNVNLINMSMNKITASNYMNIVSEITDALINDNYRKLPDYCSFLFDVVIKKCMVDEAFSKDYIRFLFGFKDTIGKNLAEYINKFVSNVVNFLTTNESLKEYGYFHYVRDIPSWRNIGVIFTNVFKLTKEKENAAVRTVDLASHMEEQFEILFNTLIYGGN
jgi:hypothetical protein